MRSMGRAGLATAAIGAVVAPCLLQSGCASNTPAAASDTRPAASTSAPVTTARTTSPSATASGSASSLAPDVLPATTTPTPAEPHLKKRPNILLITADDASILDLPYMPHVRKLIGKAGVKFADALAPTPICVPARASLLTGQYADNTGTVTISGPRGGFQHFRDKRSLPVALQKAGYQTLFTGKYLNGYDKPGQTYVPPGWTDWRATSDGTYNFYNQVLNINGHLEHVNRYTTFTMRDQADDMIRSHGKRKKPWYLWLNYVAPHVGSPVQAGDPKLLYPGTKAAYGTTVPAPSDFNRYRNIKLPDRPDMFEKDISDKPKHSPAHRHLSHNQKKALRIEFERRVEAVQGVDRAVASQIRTLKQTHQLKNTVVIFTGDNGFVTGEHNMEGKLWHYNEILRIPVLMRGPGIPRHKVVRTAITNPDIAVTIMALARAKSLRGPLDGVNMLPWLRAPEQVRVVPIRGWAVKNGKHQMYSGVRVGPWTYVKMFSYSHEMYDRRTDPYELNSLIKNPLYAKVKHELHALMVKYQNCKGKTCPKTFYPASALPPPPSA